MMAVKLLPCAACGRHGPSNAHHKICRVMGRKSSDFETMPLCDACHVSGGPGVAVHAGKKAWRHDEGELIQKTWERLLAAGIIPAGTPVGWPYHPIVKVISSYRFEP